MKVSKSDKILVFGGSGFVGFYLLSRLKNLGYRNLVSFADRKPLIEVDGVDYVEGDILDFDSVLKMVEGVDVIFHLASVMGVKESFINPDKYMLINVMGTANILKGISIVSSKLKKMVLASSDAIYGRYPLVEGGIIEDFYPRTPANPYAVSKLAQEELCRAYERTKSLPLVVLRFSNIYGPRQTEKNVIWTFIESAVKDRKILIYGDGSHGRDFTYVENAVEGLVLAMVNGKVGDVYHVSGGMFTKISDLAKLVSDFIGKVEVRHIPFDKTVEIQGFLSNEKAKLEIGYQSKIKLEQGLRKCIDWYLGRNE